MTPTDTITTPPTCSGLHGRAWRLPTRLATNSGAPCAVALWLIEAPWAHPAWHSYVLSVIHLRPLPNVPAAKFYLPAATHEIVLHALDPAHDRQPAMDGRSFAPLTPPNFAAQFIAADDDTAVRRVDSAVQLICRARLSPDTDARATWIALFGDNMVRPEHLAHGAGARHAAEEAERFICPDCGAVSFNKNDIEHRYCGRCHTFHNRQYEMQEHGGDAIIAALKDAMAGVPTRCRQGIAAMQVQALRKAGFAIVPTSAPAPAPEPAPAPAEQA